MAHQHSASGASIEIPSRGPLLGVDYGTRRVGLAISTADQTIASPLTICQRGSEQQESRIFREVLADYQVRGIILGLPIHVNGEEGQTAYHARAYGNWLGRLSGLPVDYWDERFTSAVADDFLLAANFTRDQRKKRLDMVAAQIMLQSYLDRRNPKPLSSHSLDPSSGDPPPEH